MNFSTEDDEANASNADSNESAIRPVRDKGTFLSEDTDGFVISPNRRTFYFPELENLNFGD